MEQKLWLEKTPCFIWSTDLEPLEVSKTLNTADFLPTVLNLLGVQTDHRYMGNDAFDDRYEGYALFSDGSWISGNTAYDAARKSVLGESANDTLRQTMAQRVEDFVRINNLILDTDYYGQ